jgi:hypothetical protein
MLMYLAVARADAIGITARLGSPQRRLCPLCNSEISSRFGAGLADQSAWRYQIDVCGWCLQSAIFRPTGEAGATRESAIAYLRELAQVLGGAPSYRWSQAHETPIGLPTEQRVRIVQLWKVRPSQQSIKHLFGNHRQALAEAGYITQRLASKGTLRADRHTVLGSGMHQPRRLSPAASYQPALPLTRLPGFKIVAHSGSRSLPTPKTRCTVSDKTITIP